MSVAYRREYKFTRMTIVEAESVGRQFTLDVEFIAAFVIHTLIIAFLIYFLPRPEVMWHWIGLPITKKKKTRTRVK